MDVQERALGPCPVCGAPDGNCPGEKPFDGGIVVVPPKRPDPRETFRVPHRIYQERESNGRVVKSLLYPAGAAITPAEAQRLGLLPKS